jgi:hypothetical protein
MSTKRREAVLPLRTAVRLRQCCQSDAGARQSRLVRQALTESILLSILGGVAGLAIALAGTPLILRFAFTSLAGFAAGPISAARPYRFWHLRLPSQPLPEFCSASHQPG